MSPVDPPSDASSTQAPAPAPTPAPAATPAPAPAPERSWGEQWQTLLDASGPSAARRVQRGQALARRGAVEALQLGPGRVSATVAEDRSSPFRTELRWPLAAASSWDLAVHALRTELRFTAMLLDGELPGDLVETLLTVGIRLVPSYEQLETSCTCAESHKVCRHVAALHLAAGLLVERDPVVLLQLGGRSRDELLREVRRGEGDSGAFADETIDLSQGLEVAHGDLDGIELRPVPVEDPAGFLRHLGEPPGVDDPQPLVRLVERAASGAWRLAAGDGSDAADQELLLAELRAQRMASAASLAEALGRDIDTITEELDGLFEAGTIMRTGSGERARYRAASS
jgi:uncharacterized Zn finger protein